jgi:hypothetical protein
MPPRAREAKYGFSVSGPSAVPHRDGEPHAKVEDAQYTSLKSLGFLEFSGLKSLATGLTTFVSVSAFSFISAPSGLQVRRCHSRRRLDGLQALSADEKKRAASQQSSGIANPNDAFCASAGVANNTPCPRGCRGNSCQGVCQDGFCVIREVEIDYARQGKRRLYQGRSRGWRFARRRT